MVVGFIGSGNMAAAMARGWAASEGNSHPDLLFTDSGSGRATALASEVGGDAAGSNAELVENSDFVVLAVKPAALEEVAGPLQVPGTLLSLLGGTPLSRVTDLFPETPVLRLMPNLAVEVNRGVICMARPEASDPQVAKDAASLLAPLGRVVELDDELMDAATAVMGCTPAYFSEVADALIRTGIEQGLDPAESLAMVSETLAGSAELLRHRTPFEIRVAVASPGGSTEAGLEALEQAGGGEAFRQAAEASLARMRGTE
jgi:pyrroline-5-carboxylate reductase